MECLAAEHMLDGVTLPAVLKIRDAGASGSQWSDAVMLLSGVHAAGEWSPSSCQSRSSRQQFATWHSALEGFEMCSPDMQSFILAYAIM